MIIFIIYRTNLQHIEFSIYGDVLLKARDLLGGAAFLGGNGQITRKDVLDEYKGWDGYALTEDLNISVIDDTRLENPLLRRICGISGSC